MNKQYNIAKCLITFIAASFLTNTIFAGTQPKFVLTPLTPTTLTLALDETQTVQYQVSNSTKVTRTLTMVPIQGITQTTSGAGLCANPFTLAHNQSCVLSLSFIGRSLPTKITTGPEICNTNAPGDNTPDPFLCSQPSLIDSLNITVVPVKKASLFVEPSFIVLTPLAASKSFTITNTSTALTARNIMANLTGTQLEGNVTQDASLCKQVPPGQSCTLTFTAGGNDVSLTRFPIQGENTLSASAAITIASASKAPISVSGSPLILDANQTGVLTITNHSPTITATNIQAYSVPAGITQVSNCGSVLPNGGTCTLSFTSGFSAVDTAIMPIYGDNTSHTEATISVNNPPLQTMIFVGGNSSVTLTANGTSTGTLAVQNTSGHTIAAGVTAHFEATDLNGIVTATTCPEILNNETCTITFNANRTNISATNFPIYGSNTISLDGTMTINASPEAYLTSNSGNHLYQCIIDANSGNFTQCQTFSNLGLSTPHGIVINPSKTRAYITNFGNDSVTLCDIDPNNFNLINCESALANGLDSLHGITLNPAGTIAYIPNANGNKINQCPINPITGKFDNLCTVTSATTLNSPRDVVIDPSNSFAYIPNYFSYNVTRCNVDQSTGDLLNCSIVYTQTNNDQVTGITMDTSGALLYMVSGTSSTSSKQIICPINFVGCVITSLGNQNLLSTAIAINAAGTVNYVANTTTSNEYIQVELLDGFILSYAFYNTLPANPWGIALLE